MSLYDYQKSQELESLGYPFYTLIMTAMRQADKKNLKKLEEAFPQVWEELKKRFYSLGGRIEGE